jgi:hypothetical protein
VFTYSRRARERARLAVVVRIVKVLRLRRVTFVTEILRGIADRVETKLSPLRSYISVLRFVISSEIAAG